jgi:Carboxypeptidase regulatory-like domain
VQFSASSRAIFVALTLAFLFAVLPASARQSQDLAGLQVSPAVEQPGSAATDGLQSDQKSATRISGKVVDPSGVGVAGAQVKLTGENPSLNQQVFTADDGQFAFTNVAPGVFHLTITAAAFAPQEFSGNLRPGESYAVPQIALPIASVVTEVRVVPPSLQEQAEAEINEELKQRPLGFIPNFYVSYVADAAPLSPRQKFKLAWKQMVDPVTFGLTGAIAGIQQAQNDFSGFGQGAQGYAKRYGAAYAGDATGTLIGSAILPSLFKQDPRYFYKGTGSKRSRVLYAVATSVICKGDNGHWQANYSGILGGLAAGGISNLYYPAKDRNGAALTFENALIGIGATAAANILQEFVIRKLTPNLPNHDPSSGSKPLNQIGKMFTSLIHEGD